ncbi:MAG: sugar phosphate nucleotidyltransferase [Ignavibacteriales bacterium]|nr:sugar phosphate nucleotidyltransferase [Ignavibacteriales bacterium]
MYRSNNMMGVILAGGEGVRLQNFVRTLYGYHRPKQYCTFTGTRSMFKHTIDRASMLIPQKQLFTIVNSDHRNYVAEESLNRTPITIIEQPCLRDTAAGILLPLLKIESINPDATVAIFPSDHYILNEKRFMEHVNKAALFVEENPKSIVTLGIKPDRIESGYGWIEPTRDLFSDGTTKIFNVKKFIEKPDSSYTKVLMSQGCMINTFVMIGKCSSFIKHINFCLPELVGAFQPIRAKMGTSMEKINIRRLYKYLPSFNFSKSVLENIPQYLNVLEVTDVYWSDWGDEHRINSDLESINVAMEEALLAM